MITKKIVAGMVAASLVFTMGTGVASAETDTAALQAQLDALMKQVAALQVQLGESQKSNAELRTEVAQVRAELKLMRTLKMGESGEHVKLLQELLASDPSIYPEGKVTGFFGPLTAEAVKRFQEKSGLEKVGHVGPKTLEKMNRILEDDDDGDGKVRMGLMKEHGTYAMARLMPLNDSGLMGKVKIKSEDGKSEVEIELVRKGAPMMKCLPATVATTSSTTSAMPMPAEKCRVSDDMSDRMMMPVMNGTGTVSASYPAHIHVGSCPTPGAVKYPLNPVVNGKSKTVLDVSVEELVKGLPLAVNLHKSATELATSVACGNLTAPSMVWKSGSMEGMMKPKMEMEHGTMTPRTMMGGMMMKTETEMHDGMMTTKRVVELTAANFKFGAPEIKVKKGDRVRIELKVVDGFHDWVVDEFNAKTAQVKAGEKTTVEFVADKAGTFEYYCSVGQHRANGMVGKLIVEE
ncbi:MAG TPA: peptidoglycan-binding protein [Candidatus Paceibacterota bacterium]|nr:peptidoglycan-binding protein [Candidatus Paceibacterota bacterium]